MGLNNSIGRRPTPNQPLDEYTRADTDYVAMRIDADHDISASPVTVAVLPSGKPPDETTTWLAPDLVEHATTSTVVRVKLGAGTTVGLLPAGVYRLWAKVQDTSTAPVVGSSAEFRMR